MAAIPSPPSFEAICHTTKGDFSMLFIESWAPKGYARLWDLFNDNFLDGQFFYRVVPKFLVQFGVPSLSLDEDVRKKYRFPNTIQDDPPNHREFHKGTISYAGSGPNSRVSDLFISYSDNPGLGKSPWEVPLGYVSEGIDVVESFHSYGDISVFNKKGPNQNKVRNRGEEYVKEEFPLMDYIIKCEIGQRGGVGKSRSNPGQGPHGAASVAEGGVHLGGEELLTNTPSTTTKILLLVAFLLMFGSGCSIILLVRRLWSSSKSPSCSGVSRSLDSNFARASEEKYL